MAEGLRTKLWTAITVVSLGLFCLPCQTTAAVTDKTYAIKALCFHLTGPNAGQIEQFEQQWLFSSVVDEDTKEFEFLIKGYVAGTWIHSSNYEFFSIVKVATDEGSFTVYQIGTLLFGSAYNKDLGRICIWNGNEISGK